MSRSLGLLTALSVRASVKGRRGKSGPRVRRVGSSAYPAPTEGSLCLGTARPPVRDSGVIREPTSLPSCPPDIPVMWMSTIPLLPHGLIAGALPRPALRASVEACIVPLQARIDRPVDKRRASHPIQQAAFKLASFLRQSRLAQSFEHGPEGSACALFIHLTVIAGLRRRASAKTALASSILPDVRIGGRPGSCQAI